MCIERLVLEKREDNIFAPGMRWLTVSPRGQKDIEIVLHKAGTGCQDVAEKRRQQRQVGKGTTWVFYTDNCRKDYELFRSRGVKFLGPPTQQMYGVEAIFEDLYGNQFNLLERPRPGER